MKTIQKIITNPKVIKLLLSYIVGGALGYTYYYFIGCSNGCAITSNPYATVIYFGLLTSSVVNFFEKKYIGDKNVNK